MRTIHSKISRLCYCYRRSLFMDEIVCWHKYYLRTARKSRTFSSKYKPTKTYVFYKFMDRCIIIFYLRNMHIYFSKYMPLRKVTHELFMLRTDYWRFKFEFAAKHSEIVFTGRVSEIEKVVEKCPLTSRVLFQAKRQNYRHCITFSLIRNTASHCKREREIHKTGEIFRNLNNIGRLWIMNLVLKSFQNNQ